MDSAPKKNHSSKPELRSRLRDALISGTAGAYLGSMVLDGKVKIPTLLRKVGRIKRKTLTIHGARAGGVVGAGLGLTKKKPSKESADAVSGGGDWSFDGGAGTPARLSGADKSVRGPFAFSAFIEDMTFGALPKDVQAEVSRFVDAKKGTPVVHYGMTVTELVMKADATNLTAARKALGTLRASRARDDVMGKVKAGSKYVLLMNDRIVDGHHFLAKAERGAVTSSLNVLDLTPARLSTGKVTEFDAKPDRYKDEKTGAKIAGATLGTSMLGGALAGSAVSMPEADFRKTGKLLNTAHGRGSTPNERRVALAKAARFIGRSWKKDVGKLAVIGAGGAAVGAGIGAGAVHVVKRRRAQATQFAEAEPRRNRTRDLRDKIGLAKDVAGLGVTVGAGVGAHKLYKGGKQVLRRVGPQIGAAAKAWHKAALKTGKTLDTVKDAVAPAAGVNRGVASVGRKIVQGARKVGAFLHMAHDPRLVQNFTGGNGGNGGRTLKPLFSPLSPVPFRFAEPRDRLSKARDAALLAAGAAGTGAVIYGATKMKEAGKVADNLRNTTAIGADVGRVYRKGRRVVTESVDAFKGGMKDAMSKPAPKWKKGVIRVGKKLRLLEAKGARTLLSASFKPLRAGVPALLSNEFGVGGLVGSGIGTLIGSQIGERFKYKTRNALKKKLIPKLGQKWGRRVARMGQFVPENAGALAGGVVGSIAGGGIRRKSVEMRNAECGVREFGGKEQLKEIDSGAFPDPLDVFIGRKKGYLANTVKAYHREKNYVKDVQSGKKQGTPQAVAASQAEMKRLRGDSVEASHGQVYRSLLKKGDTVRRVSERGGGLIRDAVKHAKGEEREKDAWGRTKKREWEKPWFQRTKNQVAAAAALGGGAMLLKKNPRLRARVDRGVRQAQRKVNSVVPDFFTGVKPLRQPGQKTAASVQAKRQSVAQAKAAKTQASMAANAQKIAKAAAAVKPVKAKKRAGVPALPSKRGSGTPPLKGLARINGRLIEFSDDPLDVGWDLRDARGRSARVFAPGSNARDRRPKKWHEKIDNERKLWGAAALTGTLTGAAATRKLLKGGLSKQIVTATSQAEKRAARWKTVAKNQHARLKTKPKSNVISASFKPSAAA